MLVVAALLAGVAIETRCGCHKLQRSNTRLVLSALPDRDYIRDLFSSQGRGNKNTVSVPSEFTCLI